MAKININVEKPMVRAIVRGVTLIGSIAALVTGYSEAADVFNLELTESGVEIGGAVGLTVTAGFALYDLVVKPRKKKITK